MVRKLVHYIYAIVYACARTAAKIFLPNTEKTKIGDFFLVTKKPSKPTLLLTANAYEKTSKSVAFLLFPMTRRYSI